MYSQYCKNTQSNFCIVLINPWTLCDGFMSICTATNLNQSYYFFSLLVKAKEKSSDSQWLKSVVSSGTLNDKVAALTVQIQVSQ